MTDSSTATTMPDGANDLGVELTPEQEAAFVDAQIGNQPTVKTNGFTKNEPPAKPVEKPIEVKPEDKPEDKKLEDKPVVTPPEVRAVEEEIKPADIPDVQTDDLWVEVEGLTLDAEGNPQPKTYKLTLDGGIPDEMRFKNDKQLYETLDAMREMRDLLSKREKEHEDAVKSREETTQAEVARNTTLTNWQAEDDQLVEAGLLEAPKAPPANGSEYTPEEVAADPALQLRDNIYKYMVDENVKRQAEGKSRIASFTTAFNLYNKQQTAEEDAKTKAEEDAKAAAEAELVKQRGGMVGGGSPGAASSKPYVYRSGSAKSIWAVDTSDI